MKGKDAAVVLLEDGAQAEAVAEALGGEALKLAELKGTRARSPDF